MLISDDFRLKVRKIAKKGYLGFLLMFLKTDKLSINNNNTVLKIVYYTIAL